MHIETLDEYYHYRENATYAFEGHRHTNAMSWEANILLAGSLEITCGERVFRLDTRALKEFISALKELRGLVDQEDPDLPREEGLRVIFEAGEEAFNE